MDIITRKEAIKKRMKYYFTGKPCKHGHIAKRFIIGSNCCECKYQRAMNHGNYSYKQKLRRF